MGFSYPVTLDVAGRAVVVIGSFAVAEGKAETLVSCGARVTVVAPGPEGALTRLENVAAVLRRGYRPGDLESAFLCVAWSDDPETRSAIHREARERGVLVNVMDDPPHCDFAAPAVVRRGDLVIAVSTGGRSPALARKLREELEDRYGPRWEELLDVVGSVREETLPLLPDPVDRIRRWRRALDVDEIEALVNDGRTEDARRLLRDRLVEGVGA